MTTPVGHRPWNHQIVGQPEAFDSHARARVRNGLEVTTAALRKQAAPRAPVKPSAAVSA
jgi:hypothetical protein